MKQKFQLIISAAAATFLAFTAAAQQTTTDGSPARERMTQARVERMNDAAKVTDIIGMTVKNLQGEKLGTVEDLAVDVESGRIIKVILSTGGFLGTGDTMAAVRPRALHRDDAGKFLLLDSSREKLKASPKFDPTTWDEGSDSNLVTEVYVYYGTQAYFISYRDGNWITNMDGTLARTLPRNMDLATTTTLTANPDGTWSRKPYSDGEGANNSMTSLGELQKASWLMGMAVNNLQNEKLGNVKNLLVDLSTAHIVAVVISSGGFLGMGGELSPVPPAALRLSTDKDILPRDLATTDTALNLKTTTSQNDSPRSAASSGLGKALQANQFTADREILRLNASKEMLSNAPHFKADQWPDFGQPSYIGGVYRAYNVQPYFNTNTMAAPDKISSAN